jgi:hypothetical protein
LYLRLKEHGIDVPWDFEPEKGQTLFVPSLNPELTIAQFVERVPKGRHFDTRIGVYEGVFGVAFTSRVNGQKAKPKA